MSKTYTEDELKQAVKGATTLSVKTAAWCDAIAVEAVRLSKADPPEGHITEDEWEALGGGAAIGAALALQKIQELDEGLANQVLLKIAGVEAEQVKAAMQAGINREATP